MVCRLTKEVSSGSCVVNDTLFQFLNLYAPFGGVGESGMGGYHGEFLIYVNYTFYQFIMFVVCVFVCVYYFFIFFYFFSLHCVCVFILFLFFSHSIVFVYCAVLCGVVGHFSFTCFSHRRPILRRDDHAILDVPFR